MPVELIVAIIGAVATLVGVGFGFYQWRRGQGLDRERLRLEQALIREQKIWEEAWEEERTAEQESARQVAQAEKIRDAVERYRTLLANELAQLKILDMTKPLDLEALYVQLRVREDRPARFASPEEMEPLSYGTPEHLLQLSAKQSREAESSAMRPEDALRRFGRFVALGDPGAGKTTMLRHLALRLARGEITEDLTLPIYVELREFVDSGVSDILEFAADTCRRRYGFVNAVEHFAERLDAGLAALLLDGLDEVLGGAAAEDAARAYRRVVDEVDRLSTRYPRATIAVTCRRAGWQGGLRAFHTVEVLDFGWPQIETFVRNWFGNEPARADALVTALQTNLRVQTLAANPLILSLVAIVYDRDLELPERRAQLYNRCVEVLLKEWDTHRGIRRFTRFTTDRKRDLLEEVGWHFHQQGLRYYPHDELLRVIAEFLPTIDIEPVHAQAILDEIAAQYGLLKVQANGWYGFLHLTLQEYFAAVAATERGAQAVALVVQHRHDPWWEEVLFLLAGRTVDASPLLLGILGRDPLSADPPVPDAPLALDDDVLHHDLLLAARCLAGAPRVRVPWLRSAIIEVTYELVRTAPSPSMSESSARILVAAGGRAIHDRLIDDLINRQLGSGPRTSIARALGTGGDAYVAARLTAILSSRALDSRLASAVADSLRALRHSPAIPALRARLDRELVADSNGAFPLAAAVAALGGASGAAHLRHLIDTAGTRQTANVLMWALQYSRDPAVERWLIERVPDSSDVGIAFIVHSYLALTGAAGAPRLLTALLSRPGSWGPSVSIIVSAFHEHASPSLAVQLVGALTDPDRDASVRWAVSALLDDQPEIWPLVAKWMVRQDADQLTVWASAAVIGSHGYGAARQPLRDALTALTGEEWVSTEEIAVRNLALPRITECLVALGDGQWAQDLLLTRINAMWQDAATPNTAVFGALLAALGHTDIGPLAEWSTGFLDHFPALSGYLLYKGADVRRTLLHPSIAPRLLARAESELLTDEERHAALELVAAIAQDVTVVPQLLSLCSVNDDELVRHALDALENIGRHNRVRIFADGRIAPVQPRTTP
ncbi:NACHT domain-containing protein [Phytohabitans rumicis]|uniref:NACHT domain-containing protein n=1 Tax=Phytohabitans rumicis TaxID=1076125 RepID=UPI001564C1F9|nr:NACHT domain-containing protein [Phytohabitans rumicis]